MIEESNYFEQLELDNDYIWQGEIANIFIGLKIDRISNLNDNLHLKEFSPCVHIGFTCGTHYFIHQMKKLKMYICVIINSLLITLYAYLFVRFLKENIPY